MPVATIHPMTADTNATKLSQCGHYRLTLERTDSDNDPVSVRDGIRTIAPRHGETLTLEQVQALVSESNPYASFIYNNGKSHAAIITTTDEWAQELEDIAVEVVTYEAGEIFSVEFETLDEETGEWEYVANSASWDAMAYDPQVSASMIFTEAWESLQEEEEAENVVMVF